MFIIYFKLHCVSVLRGMGVGKFTGTISAPAGEMTVLNSMKINGQID